MIIDALGTLSDAQALTVTAASTNIMDFGSDRDMGRGQAICVIFTIDVAAAGTTPTFEFTLQTDDNAGFSSPKNVVTKLFGALPSTPFAELTQGSKWILAMPADTSAERYLRVNYTLGGTSPTLTVTAQVQPLRLTQQEAIFPSGYVAA